MKKHPVAAKPTAIRRRLRTTKRSALSPVLARDPNWPFLRGCSERSEVQPVHWGATPRIRQVIDREQVLHVARLARLKLTDDEIERMAGELSGISELDLDGVEPTSHVIALENVLRPDRPRPSWSRDEVLERAPDPASGSFRVPSPQA